MINDHESAWFEACKEYYNPMESSYREELLLQLLEKFDSLAPTTVSITNSSSSLPSTSFIYTDIDASSDLKPLLNECGITIERMQQDNGDIWYKYKKLKDDARSAIHGR